MTRLTVAMVGTRRAAVLLCQTVVGGELAAVSFAGEVYALIGDGQRLETIRLIEKVKGERPGPPAVLVNLMAVPCLMDRERLAAALVSHPNLGDNLPQAFGNLSFLRLPLRPALVRRLVPEFLVSARKHGPVLQVFSFFGDEESWALESALYGSLAQVHRGSLLAPVAITSLNRHGQPSIVEAREAVEFCRQRGINLVLHHPRRRQGRGSYPIIEVGPDGAHLVRTGNQPKERLLELLPGMTDAVEG